MNLACPRDFYIHVDGLLMQAKEDGLAFAMRDSNAITTAMANGSLIGFSSDNSDYDYNPGMRFGLGFYLNHDAWNLDFNWTWLNITNYKAIRAQSGGALVPLFQTGTSTPANSFGLTGSAKWTVHYDMLDIRLTKAYHVSRYLIMKPHFGVRAGWIDQHFSVNNSGTLSTTGAVHHSDNDFWGVGSRIGFDSQWMLGKGFWLSGNFAASMLFGKFDIEQHLSLLGGDGYDTDSDFYQNCPNMEMILGFGWGHFFSRQKYYVSLEAAYEFHEWWDQLNIRKFQSGLTTTTTTSSSANVTGAFANDTVARGNFTLNGFSLKVALDF